MSFSVLVTLFIFWLFCLHSLLINYNLYSRWLLLVYWASWTFLPNLSPINDIFFEFCRYLWPTIFDNNSSFAFVLLHTSFDYSKLSVVYFNQPLWCCTRLRLVNKCFLTFSAQKRWEKKEKARKLRQNKAKKVYLVCTQMLVQGVWHPLTIQNSNGA